MPISISLLVVWTQGASDSFCAWRALGVFLTRQCDWVGRRSRLLETWCLMEYAEKGSLADALRVGRFNRPNGLPDISTVLSCLTDVASGEPPETRFKFASVSHY